MRTWNQVMEKEIRQCGLNKVDVQDWVKWRRLVWEHTVQSPRNSSNSYKMNCRRRCCCCYCDGSDESYHNANFEPGPKVGIKMTLDCTQVEAELPKQNLFILPSANSTMNDCT